jgi:hypothetical protein
MAAFEFHETMSGSFELQENPRERRPMSFTIRARSKTLLDFLRQPQMEIEGEIDVEGFADHRYLRGTLGLDVLRTGTLPYAFEFTANDGSAYVFEGKKTLAMGSLAESMTVLPGKISDHSGATVAQALLRFDVRSDLGRFLRSFRTVR